MLIARSPEKSDGGTNAGQQRQPALRPHSASHNSIELRGGLSCYLLPLICSCVPCCGSSDARGLSIAIAGCLSSGRSHACNDRSARHRAAMKRARPFGGISHRGCEYRALSTAPCIMHPSRGAAIFNFLTRPRYSRPRCSRSTMQAWPVSSALPVRCRGARVVAGCARSPRHLGRNGRGRSVDDCLRTLVPYASGLDVVCCWRGDAGVPRSVSVVGGFHCTVVPHGALT